MWNAAFSVFTAILCFALLFLFFRHYGFQNVRNLGLVTIFIFSYLPVLMSICLHAYDLSLSVAGPTSSEPVAVLVIQYILYYFTFILAWVVNPFLIEFEKNKNIITMKNRIKISLKNNIKFYIICLIAIVVGVIIIAIFDTLSFSTLFRIMPSFANLYGIMFYIITIGIGLIRSPFNIWLNASPKEKLRNILIEIPKAVEENEEIQNDIAMLTYLKNYADMSLPSELKAVYNLNSQERSNKLLENRSGGDKEKCKNKKILAFKKLNESQGTENWESMKLENLEVFFSVMDQTIEKSNESANYVNDLYIKAKDSYEKLTKTIIANDRAEKIRTGCKYGLAIIMTLVSLFFICSELTAIFGKKVSIFSLIFYSNINLNQNQNNSNITANETSYTNYLMANKYISNAVNEKTNYKQNKLTNGQMNVNEKNMVNENKNGNENEDNSMNKSTNTKESVVVGKQIFVFLILLFLAIISANTLSLSISSIPYIIHYRFIVNGTSTSTFNSWSTLFQRLIPTIAFHIQLMIGIKESALQKILGDLQSIQILSKYIGYILPFGLIIVMAIYAKMWMRWKPSPEKVREGYELYRNKFGFQEETYPEIRVILYLEGNENEKGDIFNLKDKIGNIEFVDNNEKNEEILREIEDL